MPQMPPFVITDFLSYTKTYLADRPALALAVGCAVVFLAGELIHHAAAALLSWQADQEQRARLREIDQRARMEQVVRLSDYRRGA